jgi:hypothetical protein
MALFHAVLHAPRREFGEATLGEGSWRPWPCWPCWHFPLQTPALDNTATCDLDRVSEFKETHMNKSFNYNFVLYFI